MAKYQVFVKYQDNSSAASKAQNDAHDILEINGYATEEILLKKHRSKLLNFAEKKIAIIRGWIKTYNKLQKDDVLFWQGPNEFTHGFGRMVLHRIVKKKQAHLIALLHDIDELRLTPSAYLEDSQKQHSIIVKDAEAIIVHTDRMRDWMIKNGCAEDKLIVLGIFDYLGSAVRKKPDESELVKKIIIAGNLNADKCRYLSKLMDVENTEFLLYGSNYNTDNQTGNISYEGSFDTDGIIKVISPGFGLVWDGESIDTCAGAFGDYLRYNSPHKLSLYLRAGLPVIVWNESAQTDFVEKHKVGFSVSSLNEIREKLNQLSGEEWDSMIENSLELSKLLNEGSFLSQAVKEAERRITSL